MLQWVIQVGGLFTDLMNVCDRTSLRTVCAGLLAAIRITEMIAIRVSCI